MSFGQVELLEEGTLTFRMDIETGGCISLTLDRHRKGHMILKAAGALAPAAESVSLSLAEAEGLQKMLGKTCARLRGQSAKGR